MTRVLVAEDHPLYRDGLCALLATVPGVQVTGAVDSAAAALAAAGDADLVLLDLEMPGGSGLDAIRDLVGQGVSVLVLTSHDDDASVYAALRAGAHGYLHKSTGPEELTRAVLAVAAGDGLFGSQVMERITRHFASGGRASASSVLPQLTPREREVLSLMVEGRSTAEIADHFVVSLKTVRNQVSSILVKLRARDRVHAVAIGREHGLGA
ncbi:MAG: response regulator transcription factor [Mycobacteriales bacterium]|nr:response regulator transcription factor [Mycobacteriales bacterium]